MIYFVIVIIAILVDFLFLYGIAKEHYCLSTTYAGFAVFGTIISVLNALKNPIWWLNAVIGAMFAIIACLYVQDLKFIRNYMRRQNVVYTKQQEV